MKNTALKTEKRVRRHGRIRAKIKGTESRPRLAVYRSNRYMHLEIINDVEGKTITGVSSKGLKGKTPIEKAKDAGKELAKQAKEKGITEVVFDRGGFNFTGRVKAVAEGAREGGLKF